MLFASNWQNLSIHPDCQSMLIGNNYSDKNFDNRCKIVQIKKNSGQQFQVFSNLDF